MHLWMLFNVYAEIQDDYFNVQEYYQDTNNLQFGDEGYHGFAISYSNFVGDELERKINAYNDILWELEDFSVGESKPAQCVDYLQTINNLTEYLTIRFNTESEKAWGELE